VRLSVLPDRIEVSVIMREIELPAVERGRSANLINGGVFLLVVALGAAIYLTPLKDWLDRGQLIKNELDSFGSVEPLVFTIAVTLLTAIGVPRLLLCSLGGMIFGFAWGLLWSQIGTLMGSYGIFLVVRRRGFALQRFPRLRRFSDKLESRGLLSVLLLRQLPMNGFYNTVFLGLTPVRHRDFVFGSLLGFLPLGVTACLIGAGLIQADLATGVQYVASALACSIVFGFLLNRWTNGRA
jgi:uncharacterized membrane protein YdjX (TVP38/TMEM64 family)